MGICIATELGSKLQYMFTCRLCSLPCPGAADITHPVWNVLGPNVLVSGRSSSLELACVGVSMGMGACRCASHFAVFGIFVSYHTSRPIFIRGARHVPRPRFN